MYVLYRNLTFVLSVGWNNPESTGPPIHYYRDDAMGLFSIQFTATDSVAWSGVEGTKKCDFSGLCNPQIVFYRPEFELILNTWRKCWLAG